MKTPMSVLEELERLYAMRPKRHDDFEDVAKCHAVTFMKDARSLADVEKRINAIHSTIWSADDMMIVDVNDDLDAIKDLKAAFDAIHPLESKIETLTRELATSRQREERLRTVMQEITTMPHPHLRAKWVLEEVYGAQADQPKERA